MSLAINSATLIRLPAFLEQHSIEPLEFMSRAGLTPNLFLGGPRWLPRDICLKLTDMAAEMTGAPYLGAAVGSMIDLHELGPLGESVLSASTVRHALRAARRGLGFMHSGAQLRFETKPGEIKVYFEFVGPLGADPQQYNLGTIAVLRTIARMSSADGGVRYEFSSHGRRNSGELEAYFGGNLTFGARSDAVIIDRDLLAMPIKSANYTDPPDLFYVTSAASLIKQYLSEGKATIRHISAALGVNERTLQRKLAKFGITFEHLVDVTRRDEAMHLLERNTETLPEIAFRLGYSEQANFNRAFRRWTGGRPSDFRQTYS